MTFPRWVALAICLFAFNASAQQAHDCPTLPAGSGLSWDVVQGPDFLYCKAMLGNGNDQAFAVMLREEQTFKPSRSLREDRVLIDGHRVYWYRSDIAGQPNALVRETLIELDDKRTAHIVLRANDETRLGEARRWAESLVFDDPRIGRN